MNNRDKQQNQPDVQEQQSTIFVEPSKSDKGPGKQKKKKWDAYLRLTAGLIAAVVFLTGTVLCVHFFSAGAETETETATEQDSVLYLTKDADVSLEDMTNPAADAISNILSVDITNDGGTYTIVPVEDEENVYFTLRDYDDFAIDTDTVTSIADAVFDVTATMKIPDRFSMEDCGLDDEHASAIVEVHMADGSDFTIKIGNRVPNGNGNYYGWTSLTDGIYVINSESYSSFTQHVEDCADTVLFETFSPENDDDSYFYEGSLIQFERITYSGARFANDLVLGYDDESSDALIYHVLEPVSTYASDEQVAELLEPLTEGMTASGAYAVHPTDAQLKEYGLDNPETILTYTVKDRTIELRFSEIGVKDEGYYACMVDDVPVIFMVMADLYEFVEWDLDDLRFSLLFAKNIDAIETFRVEYGQTDLTYEISEDEVTDLEGETTSELSVICSSSPVNAEYFQYLYQELVLVKASKYLGADETAPTGTPYLKITITYNTGESSDVLTFIRYSDLYYHYTINGIGDSLVRYDTVESLTQHFDDLQAGREIKSPTQ